MKLFGYVLGDERCLILSKCPACGKEFFIEGLVDDIEFENVYGESLDPDDMINAPCRDCDSLAYKYIGKELKQMCIDGDIEDYDEIVQQIRLITLGARVHLNG
jgi:hypothetical protein